MDIKLAPCGMLFASMKEREDFRVENIEVLCDVVAWFERYENIVYPSFYSTMPPPLMCPCMRHV